ncbi:MAG: DUF4920 domain-containing protein [Phycisphaerales bacterium]|nr:DUF4920 domain-containing protein [Phycisphaerales bacterium]
MSLRFASCSIVLAACALLTGCEEANQLQTAKQAGWNHYGLETRTIGEPVALASISGDEKNVIVEGKIAEVCSGKGCWITVTDGDAELFVRFQDYGFFVPRNAQDHRMVMRGSAEEVITTVEQLQEQARNAGRTEEEIAAITEERRTVMFMADSVYIEGDDLDELYKPGDEMDPDHKHRGPDGEEDDHEEGEEDEHAEGEDTDETGG